MELVEARQIILVEHLKEDVVLILEDLEHEQKTGIKDKYSLKMFKSLIRLIRYYSKSGEFAKYRATLEHVPEKYFPK